MLKDIQDSGRVNHVIRRDQSLEPSREELEFARTSLPKIISPEGLHKPSLHAKILSRLFWPQLQDDSYNIPSSITDLQKHYEAGFETLKASRKLTWLPALGQATVQLEFEDRKIVEEVHTWQATIIYAFQSPDGSQVTHTIDSLTTLLEMDEHLVRTAVKFWVSKLVLHSPSQGTYTPLETLNKSEQAALSTAQTSSAAQAQQISEEEMDEEGNGGSKETEEKMAMYWQFIQGMLKNSSSQMPLGQISMMLKMFVGEGFPYSNEELKELLQEKVQEGVLELAGGKYKLRK
jgi:anaphase-promoting complex subunit 2